MTVDAVLRDYEKAARAEARSKAPAKDEKFPFCRPICVLPTGSGKSIIFLELAWRVKRDYGWKTLIVVPFKRLVKQHLESAKEFYPSLRCSSFQKARGKVGEFDVIVTTAASMGGKWRAQLARDTFGLVVWDEAHFVAARTFTAVFRHFCGARVSVGMTATPTRGSGISVCDSENYFTHVVAYFSLARLTAEGYLSVVRGVFVDTDVSLAGVARHRGEYVDSALAKVVNTPGRNALVVERWLYYAKTEADGRGRSTLCFGVDVQHAIDLAKEFRGAGVAAEAIWSDMHEDEQERLVNAYLRGEVTVLVNVGLFIHGVDLKRTSCVCNARPMTAVSLRVIGPQIVGRGTRLSPETGKKDAIYIEFLDKDRDVVVVRGGKRTGRGGVGRAVPPGPRTAIHAAYGICDGDIDPNLPLHLQARAYEEKRVWYERKMQLQAAREGQPDFFFNVIERVSQNDYFNWIQLGRSSKFMFLGNGDFVELNEAGECRHVVRIVFRGRDEEPVEFFDRAKASSYVNKWLRDHFIEEGSGPRGQSPDEVDAAWRDEAPTPLHIGRLCGLTGLPAENFSHLSLGQACDLIQTLCALEREPAEFVRGEVSPGVIYRDAPVQYGLSFTG